MSPSPTPTLSYSPMYASPNWLGATTQGVAGNGLRKKCKNFGPRGEPLAKFGSKGLERPTPPTHAYKHREGGEGKWLGSRDPAQQAKKKLLFGNQGEALAKFWPQGSERLNPPTHAYMHRGGRGKEIRDLSERATSPTKIQNLINRGEPLAKF